MCRTNLILPVIRQIRSDEESTCRGPRSNRIWNTILCAGAHCTCAYPLRRPSSDACRRVGKETPYLHPTSIRANEPRSGVRSSSLICTCLLDLTPSQNREKAPPSRVVLRTQNLGFIPHVSLVNGMAVPPKRAPAFLRHLKEGHDDVICLQELFDLTVIDRVVYLADLAVNREVHTYSYAYDADQRYRRRYR